MKTHNQGKDTKGYQKKEKRERGQQKRQRFTVGRQNPDNRRKRHEGRGRGKKAASQRRRREACEHSSLGKVAAPAVVVLRAKPTCPAVMNWSCQTKPNKTEICTVYDNPRSGRRAEQWHFPTCWVTAPSEIWRDTYAGGARRFFFFVVERMCIK